MRNAIQEIDKWGKSKQSRWYKIEQEYDTGEGSTLGMELGEGRRTLLTVATWKQGEDRRIERKVENLGTYWNVSIWDKEGEPIGLEELILTGIDAWNEKYLE